MTLKKARKLKDEMLKMSNNASISFAPAHPKTKRGFPIKFISFIQGNDTWFNAENCLPDDCRDVAVKIKYIYNPGYDLLDNLFNKEDETRKFAGFYNSIIKWSIRGFEMKKIKVIKWAELP